jgi:hypothetical protein
MNPLAPWLWISVLPAIQADLPDADFVRDERIAALVCELGDEDYPRREVASQELVNVGEPALPVLRKAATPPTRSGALSDQAGSLRVLKRVEKTRTK